MSRASLTTTSYAILGLLAIKPWTTYELTQQMDRSLGRIWPRAVSKLYEEPKKLVAEGLAKSSKETVGRRSRTVYTITAKGRRALAGWLTEPGAGPVIEFEQLLKIFFSENGTRADALATLAATREWAIARSRESFEVGKQYAGGQGPFPERAPQHELTSRFITDYYAFVRDWAEWATSEVEKWPDDARDAKSNPAAFEETLRRAAAAADDSA